MVGFYPVREYMSVIAFKRGLCDDDDVPVALRRELYCLIVMTTLVALWWHLCCLWGFSLPWLTPIILLVGLNIYFLFQQCRCGFSHAGVLMRLVVDLGAITSGIITLTVLYSMDYPAPESFECPTSAFYTLGTVAGQVGISRLLIMLTILIARGAGGNI